MTVHRHTGGREELLTQVVLRESARLAGALREVLDADRPFDERLVDALTLTVVSVRERGWLVPLFTTGNPGGTWSEIDPDNRMLDAIWGFWRPYLHDPAVATRLRTEPERALGWLLNQLLVVLVLPDLAPDEASLRSLFATFVVPAAVHV
jgi:AcrR family transcriptional regulator